MKSTRDTRRVLALLPRSSHPAAIVLTGVLAGAVWYLAERSLALDSTELWSTYHQAITAADTRALPPLGVAAPITARGALIG